MPPQPFTERDIAETPIAIPLRTVGAPVRAPGSPLLEWDDMSLEGPQPRPRRARRSIARLWLPAVAMVALGWSSVALGGALALGWLAMR